MIFSFRCPGLCRDLSSPINWTWGRKGQKFGIFVYSFYLVLYFCSMTNDNILKNFHLKSSDFLPHSAPKPVSIAFQRSKTCPFSAPFSAPFAFFREPKNFLFNLDYIFLSQKWIFILVWGRNFAIWGRFGADFKIFCPNS